MATSLAVLDHGYVRLLSVLGDDLAVVNAARVSFDKEAQWAEGDGPGRLRPRDRTLLRYLYEHGHSSPLRHCVLSFELYAPLLVMRQWGKYRVGSHWSFEDGEDPLESWNESSRRYVTEEPVCYNPDVWRSAPENRKQGSGPALDERQAGSSAWFRTQLHGVTTQAIRRYQRALEAGVCAEQARLFLPAYALYLRARWTVSLQGLLHFLGQRLGEDAQWEIGEYARAVAQLVEPHFSETFALYAEGWPMEPDTAEEDACLLSATG